MNFFEKVYTIVRMIPEGKVASYGQIATIIDHPRAARQVGWAMNKSPADVPAHRVVNRLGILSGSDSFEFESQQEAMLRSEGVQVSQRKVDMKKYSWQPDMEALIEMNQLLYGKENRDG